MRISGPTRIIFVITTAWILAVLFYSYHDRDAVENGRSPRGLAVLRDSNTGKTFGRLSKSEVKRLGQLTSDLANNDLLKANEGLDRIDTERASNDLSYGNELLNASLSAEIAWRSVGKWVLTPIGWLWFSYLSLIWIRMGFRKP